MQEYGVPGDTGRYPLVIETSPQVFNYLNRLVSMDASESEALVRHAFAIHGTKETGLVSGITAMKNFLVESEERPQNLYHPPRSEMLSVLTSGRNGMKRGKSTRNLHSTTQ